MKSILLSIKPKYVGLIASGEKTIEVRKTIPKTETPFKCYIYCTIGNGIKGDYLIPSNLQCGKVIGEFVCDKFYLIKNQGSRFSVADEEQSVTNKIARESCLDYYDMVNYLGNKNGYGWHISDLVIYDKPKELREFWTVKCTNKRVGCRDCKVKPNCIKDITRPPQSWCYVEEL